MIESSVHGIKFTDDDMVNLDEFIPAGEFNPHNVHPWLLHDHGFTIAVVFASDEQDALDIAVDENKMDRFRITDADRADYDADDERVAYLGSACEPFDTEGLGIIELKNPPRSFVAGYNEAFKEE